MQLYLQFFTDLEAGAVQKACDQIKDLCGIEKASLTDIAPKAGGVHSIIATTYGMSNKRLDDAERMKMLHDIAWAILFVTRADLITVHGDFGRESPSVRLSVTGEVVPGEARDRAS